MSGPEPPSSEEDWLDYQQMMHHLCCPRAELPKNQDLAVGARTEGCRIGAIDGARATTAEAIAILDAAFKAGLATSKGSRACQSLCREYDSLASQRT